MAKYFEARRYSAVLLRDSRLPDASALAAALQIPARACKNISPPQLGITRATFKSRKPHYPPSVRVLVEGEGNPNQIYFGHTTSEGAGAPLILAAPYVNLLAEALGKIDSSLAGDEPLSYVRPHMDEVFNHFEAHTHRLVKATQIQVSMKRGGVDRVSLSGDNPLRSDLRRALLKVARPSGIRLQSSHVNRIRPTNVHIDLDGNLFWHLSSEMAWGNVHPVVGMLTTNFILEPTPDNPLLKVLAKRANHDPIDSDDGF